MTFSGLICQKVQKKALTGQDLLLELAGEGWRISEAQRQAREQFRIEEEKKQQNRVFCLDLFVTHGAAFGGFSGLMPDGRRRRGKLALSQIMMYGTHPSGKDFTYYLEDQGIEICAMDEPNELLIRAVDGHSFEIREAGLARDQGAQTEEVIIRKDIKYSLILDSKHEVSLMATRSGAA